MSRDLQANSINLLGEPEPDSTVTAGEPHRVNPFDLLGQTEAHHVCVLLPGDVEPKFKIAWNSFHQNFLSGIPVFFQFERVAPAGSDAAVFRDCTVEPAFPRRAVTAAFLIYVALLIFPWPELPAASRRNTAFENSELTWSGPIEDLPLLQRTRPKPKSSVAREPEKPTAAENSEAFHPRQRIYTDAPHPTHPRQTLVNPAAPPTVPQLTQQMPNMVQLAGPPTPARPRLEISEKALAKLQPRKTKKVATTDVAAPEMQALSQSPADLNLVATADGPAKPKLEINAGSAPRVAERKSEGDAAPAPEVATSAPNGGTGAASTLIALSTAPGPAAPVVPQGNSSSRIAMSPEGKPGTTGNGASSTGGGGTGNAPVGISISGGAPKPNASAAGGGGAPLKLNIPRAGSTYKPPDADASNVDNERTGPPNFGALPPGAKPEQVFAYKRVYTMNINMPNVNSVTGSWIIHFSELRSHGAAPLSGDVTAPLTMRKVDPKYPADLANDRVEGEVVLYAVIRHDGTVDGVQVVRSVDKQLDANAAAAFREWKFQPASKENQPIDVEAIVYIPFRAPDRRQQN